MFVRWTDRSNGNPARRGQTEVVHTLERPLPGGGMGRFLVAASL